MSAVLDVGRHHSTVTGRAPVLDPVLDIEVLGDAVEVCRSSRRRPERRTGCKSTSSQPLASIRGCAARRVGASRGCWPLAACTCNKGLDRARGRARRPRALATCGPFQKTALPCESEPTGAAAAEPANSANAPAVMSPSFLVNSSLPGHGKTPLSVAPEKGSQPRPLPNMYPRREISGPGLALGIRGLFRSAGTIGTLAAFNAYVKPTSTSGRAAGADPAFERFVASASMPCYAPRTCCPAIGPEAEDLLRNPGRVAHNWQRGAAGRPVRRRVLVTSRSPDSRYAVRNRQSTRWRRSARTQDPAPAALPPWTSAHVCVLTPQGCRWLPADRNMPSIQGPARTRISRRGYMLGKGLGCDPFSGATDRGGLTMTRKAELTRKFGLITAGAFALFAGSAAAAPVGSLSQGKAVFWNGPQVASARVDVRPRARSRALVTSTRCEWPAATRSSTRRAAHRG